MKISADDWGRFAHEAKNWDCRWVAAWGEDAGEELIINACFEKEGVYLIARAPIKRATPILPSHTPYFAAADRPERHMQDMLGIAFTDHPDPRRWTRHRAWKNSEYPLRKDFPVAG
ncbi:MAG: NADH-quinone oxidoreductase subunit C, partial [Pseudomonadota bacterium]